MSCGVGHRRGSNLALLWLWHSPVATAPIGPLAWKPLHAIGGALKRTKDKKNKTKQNKTKNAKEGRYFYVVGTEKNTKIYERQERKLVGYFFLFFF